MVRIGIQLRVALAKFNVQLIYHDAFQLVVRIGIQLRVALFVILEKV